MCENDIYLYVTAGGHANSHQLLLRAAADWCRRTGAAVSDFELARTETGKPHFKYAPQLHFSISHSGDFWLCAMGRQPLGLDVQQRKALDAPKLARRFFHESESNYVISHPEDFFLVWTAKESYVKFTGTGIAGAFRGFSVVENGRLRSDVNGITLRHLPFCADYALCLCCQKRGEIQWVKAF